MELRVIRSHATKEVIIFRAVLAVGSDSRVFIVTFYRRSTDEVLDRWALLYNYTLSIWEADEEGVPNLKETLFSGPSNHPEESEVKIVMSNYFQYFLQNSC